MYGLPRIEGRGQGWQVVGYALLGAYLAGGLWLSSSSPSGANSARHAANGPNRVVCGDTVCTQGRHLMCVGVALLAGALMRMPDSTAR